MGYIKCDRCELNYKLEGEEYCSVCLKELSGKDDDEDDLDGDICPFCEENFLDYGAERCRECQKKLLPKTDEEEEEAFIPISGNLIEVEGNF